MPTIRRHINLTAWCFLLPTILVLGLFLFYPILWTFFISFKKVTLANIDALKPWNIPGEWIGLRSYRLLLRDPFFWQSVRNTAFFAVIFVPATLALSLGLAILVNHPRIKGLGAYRTIFFLPYAISIVGAGIIWKWLFHSEYGLINALINACGGQGPNWLGHSQLAMCIIALMCVWRWSGYFMLIFLAGLQSIPDELYDAAAVDGAGGWQRFRHITLPLLRRPMILAVILLLIRTQGIFQEVYIMTGGGPGNRTVTVAFAIWKAGFYHFNFSRAAAMSYLLFLAVILLAAAQYIIVGRERNR
jgi:multiple sugar transport system permease protein